MKVTFTLDYLFKVQITRVKMFVVDAPEGNPLNFLQS
jgi:hypothetical protein